MLRCRLTVREGKGAKDRTLSISDDLCNLIGLWLERRPQSQWLFCTRNGDMVLTRYLRTMVKRYALRAGVSEARRMTPHVLRIPSRPTFSVRLRTSDWFRRHSVTAT